MQTTVNLFKNPTDNSTSELTSSLSYLGDKIITSGAEFKLWKCHEEEEMAQCKHGTEDGSGNVVEFGASVEDLVSNVLLVIQNIRKNHESDRVAVDDEGMY